MDAQDTIEKLISTMEPMQNLCFEDLDFLSLWNYIQVFSTENFDTVGEYHSLFDIVPPDYRADLSQERIKFCKKLIWYFNENINVRINLDITEEQFFQENTIRNFGPLKYETIVNARKLISILGRIYYNDNTSTKI